MPVVARARPQAAARQVRVFEVRALVGLEVGVDRIERYDRRQQRPLRADAAVDEVALRHLLAPDATADRRGDLGELDIQARGVDGGLCLVQRRLALLDVGRADVCLFA